MYALFQDTGGSWRIQAVPVTPDSFDSRKKLPAAWRGIRDQALSDMVGDGAIFVHASGFIGGHKTKDGALSMAIQVIYRLFSSNSVVMIIVGINIRLNIELRLIALSLSSLS